MWVSRECPLTKVLCYHSLSPPLGNPLYSPLPPKRCSVFLGPYSPKLDQEHAGHRCVSPNERASFGPSCLPVHDLFAG
jgi:hypothetical protein